MNKAKVKEKAAQMLKLFGPDGRGWAKDNYAYVVTRGRQGHNTKICGPTTEEAKSWCLLGATHKLWPKRRIISRPSWLAAAVRKYAGTNDVVSFNDANGWRPVKDFLTQLKKHGCIVKKTLKQ